MTSRFIIDYTDDGILLNKYSPELQRAYRSVMGVTYWIDVRTEVNRLTQIKKEVSEGAYAEARRLFDGFGNESYLVVVGNSVRGILKTIYRKHDNPVKCIDEHLFNEMVKLHML